MHLDRLTRRREQIKFGDHDELQTKMAKLTAEALYQQLGNLVASMPDIEATADDPATLRWLGRAHALVMETGDLGDGLRLKIQSNQISGLAMGGTAAREIAVIVHRALAAAELNAPASASGAFMPAQSPFDAFAAVTRLFSAATRDLLIVDPYLDEKILTEFAASAPVGVAVRLLTDANDLKPTLSPAIARWTTQYGTSRPLQGKVAPARSLHDRVIIVDNQQAWVLTQSFKDLAIRSPATLTRVEPEPASLKMAAYATLWSSAKDIAP